MKNQYLCKTEGLIIIVYQVIGEYDKYYAVRYIGKSYTLHSYIIPHFNVTAAISKNDKSFFKLKFDI